MSENLATFLVTYRYVPDMEQLRTPVRPDHLAWLRQLADAGQLLLAGATIGPVDSAILLFRAEDSYAVRQLLIGDPYAKANLVVDASIRQIGLAIGG
jgi:uncharacterized protein